MKEKKDSTSKKDQKGVAKYSDQNDDLALNSDFDTLYNMDEKEVNKTIMHKQNKESKRLQLFAQINNMKGLLLKAETAYRRSLVDPTMDSIEIAVDIKVLREKMGVAITLITTLFPDTKTMFPK